MEIFTKFLFVARNLIARLMKEIPVCDARIIPLSPNIKPCFKNLFLVWLEVYPAYRQVTFKSLSVSGCLIYPAEINNKDGTLYYSPITNKGGIKELPLNQVLPSRFSSSSSLKIAFFVEHENHQDRIKITVHSFQWFMSTSCEVFLK